MMGFLSAFELPGPLKCATSLPGWTLEVELTRSPWRLHACAVGVLPLAPADVADIMNSSEGDAVFRVERRVMAEASVSGRSEQEVVFMAPMRVLFWKAWSRTKTRVVTEPQQEDGSVLMNFNLIRADLMSELQGSWLLTPLVSPATGKVVGTHMHYSLSMWPKGVPTSLACVPGLFTAVQAAVGKEVMQTVEKIQFCAHMASSNGWSVRHALSEASALVRKANGSFKQCVAGMDNTWRTEATTAASLGCNPPNGTCSPAIAPAVSLDTGVSLDSEMGSLHFSRSGSGGSNSSSSGAAASGGSNRSSSDAAASGSGGSSDSTGVRISLDDDSAVDQAPGQLCSSTAAGVAASCPAMAAKAGVNAAACKEAQERADQEQQHDAPRSRMAISMRGWW